LISFKLGRTAVRMDFSFFVFNALIFLLRDSRLVLAFYTVCTVHEAGHTAALALVGGHIRSVELSGFGVRMDRQKSSVMSVGRSVFVLAAGPAANIIMYIVMKGAGCGGDFPLLNLMVAAYNMLPYRSLDGGAIIAEFTAGTVCEHGAELVLTVIKLAFIGLAAAAAAVWGGSFVPVLIAAAALYIGDVRAKN
jgi:Zn-dependent protease